MNDGVYEVSESRRTLSKRLYIFAWIIEIFAVSIGFGIAIMQFTVSFEELHSGKGGNLNFGDWTNITIAAIPFVMVSVVELSKIPFVDAYYRTAHRAWKTVFLVALMIISLITFESALNGFERNYNALNITVTRINKDLLLTEESMVPLNDQITRLSELTNEGIEREYTEQYDNLVSQRAAQTSVVEKRKSDLRASIQSEYTAGLQEQIDSTRAELGVVRANKAQALREHADQFSEQSQRLTSNQQSSLRQLAQDYEREQKRLDDERERADEEIESANVFTRGEARRRSEERLAEQEKKVAEARSRLQQAQNSNASDGRAALFNAQQAEIAVRFDAEADALQEQISALTGDYNRAIGTREKDVEQILEGYDAELAEIEEKFQAQFAQIKGLRDEQLVLLANNTEIISGLQSDVDELRLKEVGLRNDINDAVGDNQIYRLALMFADADSAADMDKEFVQLVAVIWFSSLAGMVAFTGVILAIASNVIRDPKIPEYSRAGKTGIADATKRFIQSLRRFLIYRRRLQRKPVIKERIREVTKEVPVDRVVKTEVPVEIVKRELVHVPMYTNDLKLLKLGVKNDEVDLSSDDESKQ